jgi:hypothetical protein
MYHGNCEMHVMAAIAINLDCISIGIVVEFIAISSDRALMDVDGGFDGRVRRWVRWMVQWWVQWLFRQWV